jgi:hypothetical protein
MRPKRKPLLLLLLLGMAVAVPALAQSPAVYPAACDASTVSKTAVERAHTVFLSGKGFLDESSYDKAISYFKDAYSIDCSVHGILPIIATAYERKGDKAEAIHALEEYLERVPSAPDRDVVEHRVRNLKDQLAQEKAAATAVPAPLPTSSAGAPAPTSSGTAEETPAPTDSSGVPPPPSGVRPSVGPWLVVGGGGVLVVAGIVALAVGASDVSSANDTCPNHAMCTSDSVVSKGNTGRALEPAGVVGMVVGAGGVVGGLVWHFHDAKQRATTSADLRPVVTPGFAGMTLGGSF